MRRKSYYLWTVVLVTTGLIFSARSVAQDSSMHKRNRTDQVQQYQYRDINTGKNINIRYDKKQRITYNTETGQPVDFYVNANTGDTLYGRGQWIVNSYIMNDTRGNWSVDTSRIRMTDKGLFIIDGNRKLKTEKPYRSDMNRSDRHDKRDSL